MRSKGVPVRSSLAKRRVKRASAREESGKKIKTGEENHRLSKLLAKRSSKNYATNSAKSVH